MNDDAYRLLMKHAARLAMTGHAELAQYLRDAIDNSTRYSWLRADVQPTSSRWQRWEVRHWSGVNGWNTLTGKSLDAEIDEIRQFENDEGRA